ncbi:MAG: amidophosphoribosyltransferase, partial [Enterobacteriaceae bacterium]
SKLINAQPLLFNYRGGELVVATNGNLVNAAEIRIELESQGAIFQTSSDTEVIAHLMARHGGSFVEAAKAALQRLQGGFAFVLMNGDTLLVARDRHGLRPMVVGSLQQGYLFASESCALEMLGAEYLADVAPGEIWQLDSKGITRESYTTPQALQCCAMEYIYFARPDSNLQQMNVHSARYRMGQQLAAEWHCPADMVIGVPDSSISAAMGYAASAGLPYDMGLVKSKYSGRTFIQPSQALREKGVKMKLSAVRSIVGGKRVVVIDDSLVRGTTCRRLVALLREAGAVAVYVGITSPPFKYPCFYGIDTPDQAQLPAASHSVADLQAMIGADGLYFLSQQGMVSAIAGQDNACSGLCMACFNGRYPTSTPNLSVTCKEPTP